MDLQPTSSKGAKEGTPHLGLLIVSFRRELDASIHVIAALPPRIHECLALVLFAVVPSQAVLDRARLLGAETLRRGLVA